MNEALGGFDYVHAAGDLVFKYAGAALLAEVLYRQALSDSHDGVVAGTTTALREWSRSGLGYLIQAGVMVHPRAEVVARWEQLLPQGTTDPSLVKLTATQGRQLGGGGNLYLNGHFLKVQDDYFYLFGDRLQGGQHQARLQLDASF